MRLPVLLSLLLLPVGGVSGQGPAKVGSAEIRFGGRLHVQYEQGSTDDADPGHVFARRARLEAHVAFGKRLTARLQPDFARGSAVLEDAWISLGVLPSLRVTVGQFHRTLEGFELASSNDLPVIERDGRVGGGPDCAGVGGACTLSRMLEKLQFVGRDLGIKTEAALGDRVRLMTSLTNGPGTNVPDENRAKSLSVRTEVDVAPEVTVAMFHGVHDHLRRISDDALETRYARATGLDLTWGAFRSGFRMQASWAWGDNWRAGPDARFRGVHGVGSWYLPLRDGAAFEALEPLVRIGWTDGQVGVDGARGLLITPGLAAYVQGRNRIAANLDVVDPAGGPRRWSLKVQTYVVF